MKRQWILTTVIFAGLALIGIKQYSGNGKAQTKSLSSAVEKENPVAAKPQDIDRAMKAVKSAKAPDLAAVAKELEESGTEEVVESFKEYQQQQKSYDQSFARYESAHGEYQKAAHDAENSNGPEVEAALAEVDANAKALQEETEKLNVKAAEFLEDYRRYTFEKFGLALN